MLETRNLTKIYTPKKGVPVTALGNVSLLFPNSGMVFLLGKSGSGKSTLLNLLGGLDAATGGEIIINGVSSKAFKQSDFDSYRNTYVGFIFQEYNVLEEFTVGANIALALELQGKKATDEEIGRILHEVDLDGYGVRRPNELSGGQKQRVAIARALVKNPEIIMADEPTGALDSATGRQVLETLKKLSREKLVIVVSHDREFAEKYADRIVELADGAVISDQEFCAEETPETEGISFEGDSCLVSAGYHLTDSDRLAINAYIDSLKEGTLSLKLDSKHGSGRKFAPTDLVRLAAEKLPDFRLIRSRLPMKNAFPIGVSGLKYKKFRLVITILLSCIAFGLFGLADTFAAYDHVNTCTNSLLDSNIPYASLQKAVLVENGDHSYYNSWEQYLNDADLEEIKAATGVLVSGVYAPNSLDLSFSRHYDTEAEFTETEYHIYPYAFNGFAEISSEVLQQMNATLVAGSLPDGRKNEILISSYVCETFCIGGYRAPGRETESFEKIKSPADMVGKRLELAGEEYVVSGVVDTGFDLERYRSLTEEKPDPSTADLLVDYALYSELMDLRRYSLNQVALVGNGFLERYLENQPTTKMISRGRLFLETSDGEYYFYPDYFGTMADLKNTEILWLGDEKRELAENEAVVSLEYLMNSGILDSLKLEGFGSDLTREELIRTALSGHETVNLSYTIYEGEYYESPSKEYRIVGVIDIEKYPQMQWTIVLNEIPDSRLISDTDGIYSYAVGSMPKEREEVRNLVSYSYREGAPVRYELMNSVTFELDAVNEVFQVLARVFVWIGVGFAVFASIMLANFISTSISYKKQEIGILRAIGSRGNDVFRIFFSESFVIAMINFALSSLGVFTATVLINVLVRKELGILITVVSFGLRQLLLLFVVSVGVALLASFFPVKRIAAKRPIDAIRNR